MLSNPSFQCKRSSEQENTVVLDEKNPHIRNIQGWNSDQVGREQRCVHDGHVDLPRWNRSGSCRDSEWSSRFRQVCKIDTIVQRWNDRQQKSRMEWRNRIRWSWRGTWWDVKEGNEIDSEEEVADWRATAAPRNKPTSKGERGAWSDTRAVPRLVRAMKRSHSSSCCKSRRVKISPESLSSPWLLLHENGNHPECSSNFRGIDNLRCGEGRQTSKTLIMRSVALKKGIEKFWTTERMVLAWSSWNHVEEWHRVCNCRVQESTDDKESNGTPGECDNAAAWNHSNRQVPHREQDAGTTQWWLAYHTMVGGTCRMYPVWVSKRSW